MSEQQTAQSTRSSRKGPRPRHVPVRTCIVCRSQTAKRGLVRLVRTPELTLEIDPTGRRNGRGAYLCDNSQCWEKAAASDVLAKALNTQLTSEFRSELRNYASQHIDPGTEAPQDGK